MEIKNYMVKRIHVTVQELKNKGKYQNAKNSGMIEPDAPDDTVLVLDTSGAVEIGLITPQEQIKLLEQGHEIK